MAYVGYRAIMLIRSGSLKPIILKPLAGKSLIRLASMASVLYLFFMLLWGLNYGRLPLAQKLGMSAQGGTDQLKPLATKLVSLTNQARLDLGSMDSALSVRHRNAHYFDQARTAMEQLSASYTGFDSKPLSIKAAALPQAMSLLGLGGIYFPFTGESYVNMHQPGFKLPFTICHELAHQAGVAPENEANFLAYLACMASGDPLFRYSGHFVALRYALHALHKHDSLAFNEVIVHLDKGVLLDLEANTQYWERFETPLHDLSNWVNNLYLTWNGQEDGSESYGLVVDLLISHYYTEIQPKRKTVAPPVETQSPEIENLDFANWLSTLPVYSLPYKLSCPDTAVHLDTSSAPNTYLPSGMVALAQVHLSTKGVVALALDIPGKQYQLVLYDLQGKILGITPITHDTWCHKEKGIRATLMPNLGVEFALTQVVCPGDSTACDTVTEVTKLSPPPME
jgi:hypothetical protein